MQGHDHSMDEVLRHSRVIRDETGALVQELRGAAEQMSRTIDLRGRLERQPWLTMAAAVAMGYVLGGGLFTRLTGRLLHVGTRVLLVPLVRGQIEAMVAARVAPECAVPERDQSTMETEGS